MDKILDANESLSNNIKVFDGVSNEALKEFILKADAVLIYQIPTTGVLTRLLELLIAGVPIITNNIGSRTYFNKSGVFTFEKIEEIPLFLSQIQKQEVPIMPINEVVYFFLILMDLQG